MSASVDFWEVKRKDLIVRLTPQEVVTNYTQFPEYIVRNGDGTINYIQAGLVNAADENTRGVELSARFDWTGLNGKFRLNLDGTYIDSYKTRIFSTQPFQELAGEWTRRTIFPKWKHTAGLTYVTGPWGATVIQRYVHSYKDEVPPGVVPPGFDPNVHAYWLHDLTVTYTGFKNLRLLGGIKNLFDEDPPFTAHATDFVSGAGWDPRVADPRGRSFVLSATYSFK
jgi:iron complex outermembrane receptor protein